MGLCGYVVRKDLPIFLGIIDFFFGTSGFVRLQVSQQALESLLVGVVALPVGEVADVALAAQPQRKDVGGRPRQVGEAHGRVNLSWAAVGNRPVRTRMQGGVGRAGFSPALTRLGS